jgi:hypothetical protein
MSKIVAIFFFNDLEFACEWIIDQAGKPPKFQAAFVRPLF